MSHEHERARATPRGHDLLQLLEPHRGARCDVGNKRPRRLDGADGHQARRVYTATPGGGQNSIHAHAVIAKGHAERPGFLAPLFVQVPLRRAVIDPESRRITAVAGRRVGMANQGDVAALDEGRPAGFGVAGGRARGATKRNDQKADPDATELKQDAWLHHDSPSRLAAVRFPRRAWPPASILSPGSSRSTRE